MMKTSQHRKAAGFMDGFKSVAGPLGPLARSAGAAVLTGLAIPIGAQMYEARNVAKAKKEQAGQLVESYKGMMQLYPMLDQHQDKQRVHLMFNTLANVNPTLAMDPHAAGAYIRRAIEDDPLATGAGTIGLVDMASRFDAARNKSQPQLQPWQRAEYLENRITGAMGAFDKQREKGQLAAQAEQDAPITAAKRQLETLELTDKLHKAQANVKRIHQQQQMTLPVRP